MNSAYKIRIDIIDSANISQSELAFLEDWFNSEFEHTNTEWSKPQWYLRMKYDDDIVGRIGILRRKIKVNNIELEIAGINGVIIKKDMRGKKLSKLILQQAVDFIKNELKLEFVLLLCRDAVVPIYQKLNWYTVKGPTFYEQSSGLKKYSNNTMILNLSDRKWPDGEIYLRGLPW